MQSRVETPYFQMHKSRLEANLGRMVKIEKDCGVQILHSLKSFNEPSITGLIAQKLSGMSISSEQELKMAKTAKSDYLHLYAPAFKEQELLEYIDQVQSVSFNSLNQWRRFKDLGTKSSKGLRINPKLPLPIPDHCNPNVEYSRLGVDAVEFFTSYQNEPELFTSLEGLHFHALFQSSVEGTILLLDYLLDHFFDVLPKLKWLNLGGGHNFSNENYNIETLAHHIKRFKESYPNIEFYFEPGESVTKRTGEFVTTVLDIVNINGQNVVILDTSVETHLLDVAIVNMRLKVKGTQAESTPYFYELAGNSCLQGDYIGEYFFHEELHVGDHVIFEDMMGYSMVKMTEFNGMNKAKFLLR